MEQFYDLIVNKFLAATGEYLNSLDWSYMITLMIVMWLLSWIFPATVIRIFKLEFKVSEAWRVVWVALTLAIIFYLFNDQHSKAAVKVYFQSMLASMVLYKLAFAKAAEWLKDHFPVKKKTE